MYHIDVSLGSLAGRYQWCIKDCRAEGGAQRGTETHSATIQVGGERGGTEGFGAGEICKWNWNYEDFHGLVFEVYKLYTSYCLPRMFWFVLRNSRKLFVYFFLAKRLRKHHYWVQGLLRVPGFLCLLAEGPLKKLPF